MPAILHRFGFVVLVMLAPLPGVAQQVPFRTYTAKDGLIRTAARTLYQDAQGFLWIGTTHGLSRYDGATFTNYTVKQGLANNWINDVTQDRDGALWIATNFAGLSRYADGVFTSYLLAPDRLEALENRVNQIYRTRDGTLMIGTDNGVFYLADDRFLPVAAVPVPCEAYTFLEAADGSLWIGTRAGLFVKHAGASVYTRVAGFDGIDVRALAEDQRGTIWVGTTAGMRRLSPIRMPEPLPPAMHFLVDKEIRALLLDADNTLWIGTNGYGVVGRNADGRVTTYTAANGLAGNNVLDIQRDREGDLWFATTAGVSKFTREQVINYTVQDGLADHLIRVLIQDREGHFWFGTKQGLSKLADGKIVTYTTAQGLASDYILSLTLDNAGTLWVGTTGGVSRLRATRSGDTFVTYGERQGWPDKPDTGNRARVIYQDDAGILWFGSDYGVSVRSRGRFVTHYLNQEQGYALVSGIVRDDRGFLWVGFDDGGIVRFGVTVSASGMLSLTEVARYGKSDGLKDGHVRFGFKDKAGHIWFGTRFGGAVQFVLEGTQVKEIRSYSTANGLSGDFVTAILQDHKGDFWFGTDYGVSFLPGDRRGETPFMHLTVDQGLAGEVVQACFEDRDGYLWFGTSNGVTRYDPKIRQPNLVPPPVYITQVSILGAADSSALHTMRADLAYDQHAVAFEYIGVSFKDEANVRYQYMLDGFDEVWSPVTDRRYVNYAMLPPGRYVFKVRARNADGVWSDAPATFTFHIATPFWKTWWFVGLVVLTVLGLATAGYHARVRKILELERLRREIATDLHDDLGSTLSSISIFSEIARQKTEAVEPGAAQLLQRIGDNARAMLDAMDDIVWAINPEHDALEHVTVRMQQFASTLFEAHDIDFTITIPEDAHHVRLPMEVRRHFYLIFKEATTNLVRHARCRHALVSLVLHNHHLELTVRDDGVGFATNGLRAGNGLANMRQRAAAIGAAFRLESGQEVGTTVSLRLRIT